ncbi:hypothetical protein F511_44936 [Dorcoceras hygrometricum]|uniref:Uncharacterized protein n=1 Tax=Dorcoceras hygrometricum TaxID=472368 RepID=A0A2Z7A813_9LAMI|nr:hypothetical protein F511_44936 [Dorcoceras hygrometricum]
MLTNTCRFLDHPLNCAPAASSKLTKRNYCQQIPSSSATTDLNSTSYELQYR